MSRFVVPPRVAFVVPQADATQVFLMALPDGPPVILTDTAAVIWVLAADGESDVAGAVGDVVGVPREAIVAEVEQYLRDLVGKGLLSATE